MFGVMEWKILTKVSDDLKLQLLHNRGITTKKQIEQFFDPKLTDHQKEIGIEGIIKAKKRILKAIKNTEQIIVYGDYDVDGICAAAVIYKSLTSLGANILPFMPHREKDGYGLSKSGLDAIKEKYPQTKLVITVDNGIVALEQSKYAKKLGFDLIITDHHLPLEELPKVTAIVHSTAMCGVAVAWCLARSMVSEELAAELLQFVAIGTIADQMNLVGLGRAFVAEGLRVLNQTSNPGLRALIFASSLEFGKIGSYEIGHIMAPKLNAAGRMNTAMPSLKLLCTNKSTKAMEFARELIQANSSRQDLTTKAIEEAGSQIEKTSLIHVVYSQDWIPGIIGLVAARITDQYQRPAVAISVGEERAKGSARSVDGVNIVEILRQCQDLLIDVGGHSGAAGFSLESAKIEEFKKKLNQVAKSLKVGAIEKSLEVEAEIESQDINKRLIDIIDQFEPFGAANPRPVLVSKSMKLSDIEQVGGGKHLKFLANEIPAIAFGLGNLLEVIQNEQLVDLAYQLEINRFNGSATLQLKIKDIH